VRVGREMEPGPLHTLGATDMNMPRYKFIVHGIIGEQRGEGAKVAAQCLWDSDTDALAREVYVTVGCWEGFDCE
jgi:hypothetical protein